MRIRIFDNAKLDLFDGFAFYETQASGVGQYFLSSLYSDIDSLALYAGVHRKEAKDFHWMLSKRFPYAIYYTLGRNSVTGLFWQVNPSLEGIRRPNRLISPKLPG